MSKRRSYKSGGGFRDQRTFVIVTEGARTEVEYFQALVKEQRKLRVITLPPSDGTSSAPVHALRRAVRHVTELGSDSHDQLWIVLDTDRWSESQLMEVVRACDDRGWGLVISNPCFELWLHLHYADLPPDFNSSSQGMKQALKDIVPPAAVTNPKMPWPD